MSPLEYQLGLEGDYVKCEALSQFLLEHARSQGDEVGVATGKLRLANAMRELGQARPALALNREAIAYWEEKGDEAPLARALVAQAIVELTLADFQTAQRSLQRAVALAEKVGDKATLIPALNTLGNVYRQQGRPERALEIFERARRVVGDDTAWNMAFIFNNMGQCHEAMGEPERAAAYIQKALAVAERVKFRPRVANANTFLGEIRLAQGRDAEARPYFEAALALSRELHIPQSEARALQGIARLDLRGGRAELALAGATGAAAIYREGGSRDLLAPALTLLGRCLHALGRDIEARKVFAEAIAEVEAVRTQLAGGEADAQSFLERQVAPYQELVALLVDAGQPAEALARAEQAKARVLRELVRAGRPDLDEFLTPDERATTREHSRRVANANRALGAELRRERRDETALATAQAALRRARNDAEEFQDLMRNAHPSARGRTLLVTPDEFRPARLPMLERAGILWIEFVMTEERTFIFSAGPDSTPRVRTIDVPRRELARRVEEFRRQIAQRNLGWRSEARTLHQLLLEPLVPEIAKATSIVLVPDGALWELPFPALLDAEGHSLLERAPLRLSTALAMETRLEPAPVFVIVNRPSPEGHVLLVGNPALGAGGEFAALPETEAQLDAIAAMYPTRTVTRLTGEAARVDACLQALPENEVLHFATHGVLNNAEPLASCLVLSQAGLRDGEDGFLEARAILQQGMSVRVAVLEACETGRGRTGAGEGLLGLSWAFLAAGCENTVVSQWKVESASAGTLMIELHRRLSQGAKPEMALRDAALLVSRRKETAHPFYWAPFVVIAR